MNIDDNILRSCVSCGRDEFDIEEGWTQQPTDTLPIVDVCALCALTFDPTASYDPAIIADRYGMPCPECAHARSIISAGSEGRYQCARCGSAVPT